MLQDRLYDCYAGSLDRFLAIVGDTLDLIELPGDDFAGNTGPVLAPVMFETFFKAPYARLIDLIKVRCPHIKVVFHSEGAIASFQPRLIEIGVDVFHPLEPLPATDLAAIKEQYGDQLVFLGGIDIHEAMPADEAHVDADVRQRRRQLGKYGGYLLAPTNHL